MSRFQLLPEEYEVKYHEELLEKHKLALEMPAGLDSNGQAIAIFLSLAVPLLCCLLFGWSWKAFLFLTIALFIATPLFEGIYLDLKRDQIQQLRSELKAQAAKAAKEYAKAAKEYAKEYDLERSKKTQRYSKNPVVIKASKCITKNFIKSINAYSPPTYEPLTEVHFEVSVSKKSISQNCKPHIYTNPSGFSTTFLIPIDLLIFKNERIQDLPDAIDQEAVAYAVANRIKRSIEAAHAKAYGENENVLTYTIKRGYSDYTIDLTYQCKNRKYKPCTNW